MRHGHADDEEKRVAALKRRAAKLGYNLDMLSDDSGYYLARLHPGSQREVVLGGNGGVTLDAIAAYLDEKYTAGGSP